VKESGWPPFDRKIWQVSCHDRIVRDEDELNAIRRYIQRNPERRWLRLCAERNSNAR
jgi:putative transposase